MYRAHQRPPSRRSRNSRVLGHLPLVRYVARRLWGAGGQLELDDLVSAGTIGLIEAADRYDATRGVPFATFAYRRIRGAIIDEITRLAGGGAEPTARRETLSLDAPIVEEPSVTLLDVTVDRSAPEPQGGAELAELLEAVAQLPRREREMLGLSFAGHSVTDIARAYGCSESLVSQLLLEARFRLGERTAA